MSERTKANERSIVSEQDPFLDGNGRVGRLLITLLLCHAGVLREPLLYLSLYLEQNRSAYCELLDRVRWQGDWEAWLDFFLEGVR